MMEFEISLNNLVFYAYHGVLEEERKTGNEFRVDLTVVIPYDETIKEDDISGTVSYADLYEIVSEEIKTPRKLLEKIASDIADKIKTQFSDIKRGEVRIEKVKPPIPGMLGTASVTLKF